MDGQTFDELTRATMQTPSRRGALGIFAGAALSGLAWFDQAEAKKRRRKNKKKKRKKGGNNAPPVGGCSSAAECGAGQACQGGLCVPVSPPPPPPECVIDNDCGDNEICQSGGCICPEALENRCVVRCSESAACPGNCLCRGLFPGDGQPRVVCVDEPFDICGAPSCTNSGQCDNDEICVFTTCGSSAGSGRCFPVCVE
jgi:hypothetical protein